MTCFETLKSSEEKRRELFCRFLLCCIGVGAVLHVVPYFYGRSLWVDEAMLASSICTRDFASLVASPLDFGQSAAIGWLFIEKLIVSLFGMSEAALRGFQLVSAFGCMALLYFIMRGRVKKHYALLAVAVFSLTNRFIYYGNECKPYMFDNFCCLLIMFLWQKRCIGTIRLGTFVAVCAATVWFSFSAVFFIAACMVIECISSFICFVQTKNAKPLLRIALCLVVLASFVLNYVFWLRSTSDNAGGADYWALLKFPLVPKSLSDVILIARMAWQFFTFYHNVIFAGVLCLLFVLWCARCIQTKHDDSALLVPFIISLVLLFGASACGFYPIQDRLVQSWLVFVLMFAIFTLDAVERGFSDGTTFSLRANNIPYLALLLLFLAFVGANGCKMLFGRGVYNQTSEVKSAVRYLNEHLTERDSVYVYADSVPVYMYEYGYANIPVVHQHDERPSEDGRIFFGNRFWRYFYKKPYRYEYELDSAALEREVQRILRHDSVYLFNSHGGPERMVYLTKELEKYGTVTVANQFLKVCLYHFEKGSGEE